MWLYPTYGIEAGWAGDVGSTADISSRILEMTRGLSEFAPSKSDWRFVDGEDFEVTPLAEATSNMASLLNRNIRDTGPGGPDPREGYAIVLIGSEDDNGTVAGNDLHVTAVVGSEWKNSLRFQVGDIRRPNDFGLITYPNYKAALETLAAAWPCPWAFAYTFDSSRRLGRARSAFDFAWIAYLSTALAEGLTLPTEIKSERTPGGGMLLSAVEAVIDQDDPDHMRRSQLLTEVLAERVGASGPGLADVKTLPPRAGPY